MKVELENVKPMDIEKRSFEIITEELGDTPLVPGTELVVKSTFSFFLSGHCILRKGTGSCTFLPGALSHMDLISCEYNISKRCKVSLKRKELMYLR